MEKLFGQRKWASKFSGVGKMAQWIKVLAIQGQVPELEPSDSWWKGRTDLQKLSSDFHIQAMTRM